MEHFNDPRPCAPCPGSKHDGILDEKKFGKYFLLAVFILSLAVFIGIIRVFILDIILAAVFATLFYPVYRRLAGLFRGNRGAAAFTSCVLILICLLIPVLFIANVAFKQATELYHAGEPWVRDVIAKGDAGFIGKIKSSPFGAWIPVDSIDWKTMAEDGVKVSGSFLAKTLNQMSRATLSAVVNVFIILFSIFYFLRDGESMLRRLKAVVPVSEEYKDLVVERFTTISRATVKGTFLIALIQSSLGMVTLFLFGVKAWLLLGIVMLIFAVIPFVGPGAVLIPTGIIAIISGDTWQGVAIIAISMGIVSTIDNVLRPRVVGAHAGMHDLLVFFSTLGGVYAFGPAGFIVGPLVVAIFLTILDIYSREFQGHIEYHTKPAPARKAPPKPVLPEDPGTILGDGNA